MNDKRRIHVSKFMSKYLRHSPEEIGLTLEPGGWVLIADLLTFAAQAGVRFTREELDSVVRNCEKQRFSIDETGVRIRANQGHSAEVELHFEAAIPPTELFHGTAKRNLEAILQGGLLKMARHHVHLSGDEVTALKVGQRHGKPVILIVESGRMHEEGHNFFRSANGVWLVNHVPPKYLRVFTTES